MVWNWLSAKLNFKGKKRVEDYIRNVESLEHRDRKNSEYIRNYLSQVEAEFYKKRAIIRLVTIKKFKPYMTPQRLANEIEDRIRVQNDKLRDMKELFETERNKIADIVTSPYKKENEFFISFSAGLGECAGVVEVYQTKLKSQTDLLTSNKFPDFEAKKEIWNEVPEISLLHKNYEKLVGPEEVLHIKADSMKRQKAIFDKYGEEIEKLIKELQSSIDSNVSYKFPYISGLSGEPLKKGDAKEASTSTKSYYNVNGVLLETEEIKRRCKSFNEKHYQLIGLISGLTHSFGWTGEYYKEEVAEFERKLGVFTKIKEGYAACYGGFFYLSN
ncbi:MAG TPA: hypothetical protein VI564_07215 [Candidatus Nanoarchaeia archaeon]|nr:hypothetical protein [Candidatus Nanoarchaeia archaeon]